MKQMDRQLLILTRLREERPLSAHALAEACECSVRTIYRDIEALCAAGVPVAAMPGEGYRLVGGYHLPPIAFSAEEATQLLLGADVAIRLCAPDQREAVRSATAKVEAVLDEATLDEVARRRERMIVAPWASPRESEWLPVLVQAVLEGRVLRLRYHGFASGEVTEREVEPQRLVFYADDWHLHGHCRLRDDDRDFRLARVQHAEVLAEVAPPRPAPLPERPHHAPVDTARIWLDARAVPWAREDPPFGFEGEEPAEDGTVFLVRCWDLPRLVGWVLHRGARARVLEPATLVEQVRDEVQALAERYRCIPAAREASRF